MTAAIFPPVRIQPDLHARRVIVQIADKVIFQQIEKPRPPHEKFVLLGGLIRRVEAIICIAAKNFFCADSQENRHSPQARGIFFQKIFKVPLDIF